MNRGRTSIGGAGLDLIEMNTVSPLVKRLVHEIRCLQDELIDRDVRIGDLEHDVASLEDRVAELQRAG